LVAVRIRLALAAELADGDAMLHEMLEDIGESVDAAIEELREVARGIMQVGSGRNRELDTTPWTVRPERRCARVPPREARI
jgi:hypothetical protein